MNARHHHSHDEDPEFFRQVCEDDVAEEIELWLATSEARFLAYCAERDRLAIARRAS
jgi:hypothetical protein